MDEIKTEYYKAISLWQPWAWMIPLGLKPWETRPKPIKYRGELLICSAKHTSEAEKKFYLEFIKQAQQIIDEDPSLGLELDLVHPSPFPVVAYEDLGYGKAVCLVDVVDCQQITKEFVRHLSPIERLSGNYALPVTDEKGKTKSRYAWKLENIRPVKPIPVRGSQGFFRVEKSLIEVVNG